MRRVAVAAAAALAAVTLHAPEARAAACGLPDPSPLWVDYAEGSVIFRNEVFGRPGVIAATSGIAVAAELRTRGAQTVYWENKLGSLVGTTTAPRDPATIAVAANRLVDKAVASSGCATPLIALNELNGPGTTTPWTPNNAQYRANVLNLLRGIAARGARPFLLLPSAPYTGGEALDWWKQVAQVSDIVPEIYFQAPRIMRLGVVLGSRTMRQAYREGIANLLAIGVSPARMGIVIGFQSGPNTGGREGLQPSSAWFRFVKLQTLAAKQVASELAIGSVWAWGWGTFSVAGADPDKPTAACVELWSRDTSLCDGPGAAGVGFDASLDEGQIRLAAGARCELGGKTVARTAIARLAAVTHDSDVAVTALYERLVESERARVSPDRVLAAERSVIALRFRGSRAAYLAALRRSGATLAVARGVIADQLRRQVISSSLAVPGPTGAEIEAFYGSYPDAWVRLVKALPAPAWLGGRPRGFVLSPPGPARLLALQTGVAASIATAEGTFQVTPLEEALPLSAVPLALVRRAVSTALAAFARAGAFDAWTIAAQDRALNRTTCLRDDLPTVGSVDLSTYLPALALA